MKRWFFVFFGWICLTVLLAEWITNDQPIMIIHKGRIFFPAYVQYCEKDFGGATEKPIFHYRKDQGLWPLFHYGPHTLDYAQSHPAPPFFIQRSFTKSFTKPLNSSLTSSVTSSVKPRLSSLHILGTDDQGRDVFARLLYGTRISLLLGLLLAFLGSIIGFIVGGIQGYWGGRVDIIMGRILEIWSSIPSLFLMFLLATPNFFSLLFLMLCFNWLSLANTVRCEFLRARSLDYVIAARLLGLSSFRIIQKHMLPNAIIGLKSHFPFLVNLGLVQLASLHLLGFGLSSGLPSLGDLLAQAKDNLDAPWIGVSSFGMMLCILGFFVFIGEDMKHADSR